MCSCSPRETETWGLVVNEAMACGLPAVVSEGVGCAPDLIVAGETGEMFPMGDTDALADAMERALLLIGSPPSPRHSTSKMQIYSLETAVEGIIAAMQRQA